MVPSKFWINFAVVVQFSEGWMSWVSLGEDMMSMKGLGGIGEGGDYQ